MYWTKTLKRKSTLASFDDYCIGKIRLKTFLQTAIQYTKFSEAMYGHTADLNIQLIFYVKIPFF